MASAQTSIPYPHPFWARAISFVLALTLATLILVYPKVLASSVSEVHHGLLSMMMWGVATGFIHGVGFVPRMAIWRIVFSPFIGWPLMLFGIARLLLGH